MITLGTGIGTSAVIQGRVLRGRHSQDGALGSHITVRHNGGRACTCSNVGCAEAEASTASLAAVAASLPEWKTSPLSALPAPHYQAVFQHAAAGDACAIKLRDHSLLVWATLVVNLIHSYDPEIVVIGGGIMAGADVILPAIRDHVRRHAHTPRGQVRIVASELGDNAALVPGEWLLQEQFASLK